MISHAGRSCAPQNLEALEGISNSGSPAVRWQAILEYGEGAQVGLAIERGRLVVEPQRRPAIPSRSCLRNAIPRRRVASKAVNGSAGGPPGPRSSDGVWRNLAGRTRSGWAEQRRRRPPLIVSRETSTRVTPMPAVVPITSGGVFARTAGFAGSLAGKGTETAGVIRYDRSRALDLHASGCRKRAVCPPPSWTKRWRNRRRSSSDRFNSADARKTTPVP